MAKPHRTSRSRRPPSRFWLTALIFLGVLGLVGVSIMSFVNQRDWTDSGKTPPADAVTANISAAAIPPAETPVKSDSVDKPATPKGAIAVPEIVDAYLLREGGDKAIENLKSVQMVGKLTVAGRVFDFELVKKMPDRVRIQIQDAQGCLIVCSDGNQAWMAFRDPKGRFQDWDLDATARDWLWLQSPPGNWLLHPQNGVRLTLGEKQNDATSGTASWPVSVSSPGGRTAVYYLDASENYPRRMELRGPESTAPVLTTDLGDFSTMGGFWLPKKLTMHGGAGPDVLLEIKNARFNYGIIDAMFQRAAPDDTVAAAMAAPSPALPVAPQISTNPAAASANTPGSPPSAADVLSAYFKTAPAPVPASGKSTTGTSPMARPVLEDYGFPWPLPW